ncbi:MAG: hypothetical protein ACI37S_02075 [Candidatus Gastranaerophilaceae bacterium]
MNRKFVLIIVLCSFLSNLKAYANYDDMMLQSLIKGSNYTLLYQGAFNSNLAKKYPNARNSQTECFNLIKEYMKYKNLEY